MEKETMVYKAPEKRVETPWEITAPAATALSIPTLRVGRAEWNKTQQKQLAVFDVGKTKPRINRRLDADLVTASCHPEQARIVVPVATNTTTSPRASKFCFLKLPVVFGYIVPFAAISKSKTARGLLRV